MLFGYWKTIKKLDAECCLIAILLDSRFSLNCFSIEALKQKPKATHNRTIYSHVLQLFRPNQAMHNKEGLKGWKADRFPLMRSKEENLKLFRVSLLFDCLLDWKCFWATWGLARLCKRIEISFVADVAIDDFQVGCETWNVFSINEFFICTADESLIILLAVGSRAFFRK